MTHTRKQRGRSPIRGAARLFTWTQEGLTFDAQSGNLVATVQPAYMKPGQWRWHLWGGPDAASGFEQSMSRAISSAERALQAAEVRNAPPVCNSTPGELREMALSEDDARCVYPDCGELAFEQDLPTFCAYHLAEARRHWAADRAQMGGAA